jgi:5-(carboxyamino)imidazole ribonucleotide mutase
VTANENLKSQIHVISIIMGSKSDWPTMKHAADVLDEFGVAYESKDRLGPSHTGSAFRICESCRVARYRSDHRRSAAAPRTFPACVRHKPLFPFSEFQSRAVR